MRKCGLMFGLFIIVLIIASKIKQSEEKFNENLTVAVETPIKRP
ncbi:hypothetical protein Q2T41_10535 [Maribacter confluentis]|uniref:Uncharacterized protein n=2 Tax=Maribacter TaxID=252356 RepID=A0ABY1SCE2_9FLAO|nr:hypothetical protein [Maribacter confluentis]MDO1513093.1 hypothetical protein [Maribacter confluentis]TVZ16341.1 hypothetical protein JM81_2600 [Maribacter sp. MAR_2009_72]SNR25935.1 hypothetical protein SAMN04488009_0437 [Maribacter sedimenticola]